MIQVCYRCFSCLSIILWRGMAEAFMFQFRTFMMNKQNSFFNIDHTFTYLRRKNQGKGNLRFSQHIADRIAAFTTTRHPLTIISLLNAVRFEHFQTPKTKVCEFWCESESAE